MYFLVKVVVAFPFYATHPLFLVCLVVFLKSGSQRTMNLLCPFYRGRGSKLWHALGCRYLASLFLTLSLSLVCFLLYFSPPFWVGSKRTGRWRRRVFSRIVSPWYSPKQDLWKRGFLLQVSHALLVWCSDSAFGGCPSGFVVSAGSFCVVTTCLVK